MSYTDDLQTLQDYYANLLIVQYNGREKATATIRQLVLLLCCNMIFQQIRDGFDWRTAVGAQLDIIGKWVGVSRFYNGQFFYFHPWFSLVSWNSNPDNLQGGFSTFYNFDNNDGGFLTYNDILPTQNRMGDANYITMIGLKIIKNSINHTAKNIDDAIWEYFNGEVYTVWEPHTLVYYYAPELREVLQVAYEKDVLPVPSGVSIELREIIE